jgi:hypothetical protein
MGENQEKGGIEISSRCINGGSRRCINGGT